MFYIYLSLKRCEFCLNLNGRHNIVIPLNKLKGGFMLCEYGCNQNAQYTLKNGKYCCSSHYTQCPELRRKNSENLKKAYKEDRGTINHKIFSIESRQRMGSSNRGKNKYNCEHIMRKSETTRKNFSDGKWIGSFTGKNHTPETLEKLRNAAI